MRLSLAVAAGFGLAILLLGLALGSADRDLMPARLRSVLEPAVISGTAVRRGRCRPPAAEALPLRPAAANFRRPLTKSYLSSMIGKIERLFDEHGCEQTSGAGDDGQVDAAMVGLRLARAPQARRLMVEGGARAHGVAVSTS